MRPILKEHDGPMLRYGIQEIRGQTIWTPTIEVFRPDRELLDIRFEAFKKAG